MEEKNGFQFEMLGQLRVYYNGTQLKLDRSGSTKMMQMLAMAVFYREGLQREKLLDNLYGDKKLVDLNNNLRVTMFKLRTLMQEAGLPDEKYIQLKGKQFIWATEIPTSCDVWDFWETIRQADSAQAAGETELELSYRRAACQIYRAPFLYKLPYGPWAAEEGKKLKADYTKCLQRLCQLLQAQEAQEAHEEIIALCQHAETFYPNDEWQLRRIDSLIALERFEEALSAYQNFTEQCFKNRGLTPTQDMITRYEKICGAVQTDDTTNIFQDLRSAENFGGADYVSYPSFIDRFRLIQSMSERDGKSNYLLSISMQRITGKHRDITDEDEWVDGLMRTVLNSALRRTDTYTRHHSSLYLVILVGISVESINIVTGRIDAQLRRNPKGRKLQYEYKALPMRKSLHEALWETGVPEAQEAAQADPAPTGQEPPVK